MVNEGRRPRSGERRPDWRRGCEPYYNLNQGVHQRQSMAAPARRLEQRYLHPVEWQNEAADTVETCDAADPQSLRIYLASLEARTAFPLPRRGDSFRIFYVERPERI